MDKQDKICVMKHFINVHSIDEIAEFIVNLDESLNNLVLNYNAFLKEYRKLLSTSQSKGTELPSDSLMSDGYEKKMQAEG